jgi:hypothetical protein
MMLIFVGTVLFQIFANFELQIWCAAGVNLQGGRTRDGGSIVGASVFYTTSRSEGEEKGEGEMPEKTTCTEVDKLDRELKVCIYIYIG